MTPSQAAEAWKEAKRAEKKYGPMLKACAEILKEHFRKTGKAKYKGVGYAEIPRTILNQPAVKVELADRLEEFQKTSVTEQLSLLE